MNSIQVKGAQGQREEVGDTLYKVIIFFFGTLRMLSFKCLLLKKKFRITPVIPSLFSI